MRTAYTNLIRERASFWRLDPDLLEAQVIVESSGLTHAYRYEPNFWARYLKGKPEWDRQNPQRVSASYGLMQVMYPTATELGYVGPPEHLFVPEVGLDVGAHLMRSLLDWAHGDVIKALVAYNGGKGSAMKEPYPTQPQQYANRVLKTRMTL